MEKIEIERELLLGLYWGLNYSAYKISKLFNVSKGTIARNLKNYGIPIRNNEIEIESELLWALYYGNDCSMEEISSMFNCVLTTIRKKLNEYEIPTKIRKINIKSELLYKMYINDKLTLEKIAIYFNCSPSTISSLLDEYNISKREDYKFSKGDAPWNKGLQWPDEIKRKISKGHIGKLTGANNPNWCGGRSLEPYGREFNNDLRKRIRRRDNYICQECDISQDELGYKLSIHHINYDKQNNSEENLISLCRSCHSKTNLTSREQWTEYFQNKLINWRSD